MIHVWKERGIEQRPNGYVCLTDMAGSENVDVFSYSRLVSTKDYIAALSSDLGVPVEELYFSENSGRLSKTWVHPEIAIDFAHWVSMPFRIWANRVLRSVVSEGGYIMPTATSDQVQALVAEYEKENADLRRQVLSYERGMRSIDGFVDECLEIQKDTKSNAYFEEIYGVYVHHCKGLQKPPVDARDLYNILRQRLGVEYAWKDVWTGIAIAPRYREIGHESPRLFQYN